MGHARQVAWSQIRRGEEHADARLCSIHPYSCILLQVSAGGLVSALKGVQTYRTMWIGWPGKGLSLTLGLGRGGLRWQPMILWWIY